MNGNQVIKRPPSVLFFFPQPAAKILAEIEASSAPSERLYGFVELRNRGWKVDFCDSRFNSKLFRKLLHYGIRLIDWESIKKIARYDVIVVKDDYSTPLTICARLLGKKIVYMDSMFALPKKALSRFFTSVNIRLASKTIAFSQSQIDLWVKSFKITKTRLALAHYGIDTNFYAPSQQINPAKPYVISTGRDLGRDFKTLIEAMDGTGLELKLVTLPYLLPEKARTYPWIEILEYIPYETLFQLYAGAEIAVVPLKSGLTYPSGIRAVLEAIALGRATIVTRTQVLEEYVQDREHVIYYEAENPSSLCKALELLQKDDQLKEQLEQRAKSWVREKYGMDTFVDRLEAILKNL